MLLASLAFAACNSSYGTDAPETAGTEAGVDANVNVNGTDGATDVTTTTDGGVDAPSPCMLSRPPGVFSSSSFDQGTCEGWAVANGTIEWVASPARCGGGACRVCALAATTATLYREFFRSETGGTYQVDLQVYGETLTGAVNVVVGVADDAGVYATAQNVGTLNDGGWSPLQLVLANQPRTSEAMSINVYGTPNNAGKCWLVDEISFAHY